MKKSLLLSLLLLFICIYSSFSLPSFTYREIATGINGNLIASTNNSDAYVDARVSLYDEGTQLFQQYFYETWVNQFGLFDVWFGEYYNQQESLWVNIYNITATANMRIKVELHDYTSNSWYVVSFKQLTDAVRNLYYYGTLFGGNQDNSKNKNSNTSAQNKSVINFSELNGNSDIQVSQFNALYESSIPVFDVSKGDKFVYTGIDNNLKVIGGTPGQIIYITNSSVNGTLKFSEVAIDKGDTYSFIFTGKKWSRIK